MEVAEPAAGPDSVHAELADDGLDHGVLLRRLHRHQVHAHVPADVTRVQPPNLQIYRFTLQVNCTVIKDQTGINFLIQNISD